MQFALTPDNPAPPGFLCRELVCADAVRLRYGISQWRGPRGTVCIFPGRGDFIERYFETIGELASRGYSVVVLDWRGQGGSARLQRDDWRSNVPRFSLYARDIETFMREVVLPDCPPPYLALGHSMGGAILLRALSRHLWFDRAVLTSPMIDVNTGRWPPVLARLVAHGLAALGLGDLYAPGRLHRPLRASDYDGNELTSDRRRFLRDTATLAAEPRLGLGGPTIGWLSAAFRVIDGLRRMPAAARPLTPVLIVAAGAERITSTPACQAFAARVPKVACVVLPRARHEILFETDDIRAQFWAAFDSFMAAPPGEAGLTQAAMTAIASA